jgi:hypothetical protein
VKQLQPSLKAEVLVKAQYRFVRQVTHRKTSIRHYAYANADVSFRLLLRSSASNKGNASHEEGVDMDEHHPAKSMIPQTLWTLLAIAALSVSVVILWSPWDDSSDSNPGQGGSDTVPQEQIAIPTPPAQGTPNP